MKKAEIAFGKHYVALVSGQLAIIRIVGSSPFGGWSAENVKTKRSVRVRSAQRLRYEVIWSQVTLRWIKVTDATPEEKAAT